jgi:tRNA(fMet)-specific endonuclease VapC
MTQLYMLDTNTVSYILKGTSLAARSRLSGLRPREIACISSITEAELWFGLERVGASEVRKNALRTLLGTLQIFSWGRQEAAAYGSFRSRQEAIGKPLGPLDTLIAAHSIAVGAMLVSNDTAFQHAAGLAGLEVWATDLS